ncbi:MAG TPA: ComEC/Rec2 family competence protein [Algoriphagus sp.]|nr:ComEC/Rec2 family competence protein [Algoriphagus sp.]
MRFTDFPFLRYLPFLVSGVLLSQKGGEIPFLIPVGLMAVFWALYGYFIFRRKSFTKLIPAFLAFGLLFCLGYTLSEIQKKNSSKNVDSNLRGSDFYLARVEKHDIEKPNSFENLLNVIAIKDSVDWKYSKGKVLIYHKSDVSLVPGQVILVKGSPESIPPPIFPDEFDYKGYLARKDIHFRQFIGEKFQIIDSSEVKSSAYWLENFRRKLVGTIEDKVPNSESQQIAAALLLGQKENLDKEIQNAYAETGTMHILAVSGLHVGILYAILIFPLKGIRLRTKQKKIYLLAVICLIWIYAVLTGFSPSVIRAATMFSLFTLGQLRERKPSSFNILAFSALIMITLDPGVIFEVGFQLSYLAVGGILLIQPLILNWWLPPNKVLEYIWQMTAVSLAAQLATFPLSILYFHIFPTYFLIANLIIIPLSFLVMQAGIPLLALSWVPLLSDWLGWLVSGLIWIQNWITMAIQHFPGGNMDRLTISFSGMLLIWGLLVIWANWELGDRKKLTFLSFLLIFIWSSDQVLKEIRRPASELFIFSGEKGVLIDFQIGEMSFSWNEKFPTEQISFSIDPNRIARHRPQAPVSANAMVSDSILWFPAWDFKLDPETKSFLWGNEKPVRIEKVSRYESLKILVSDSLIANSGAFRVVF